MKKLLHVLAGIAILTPLFVLLAVWTSLPETVPVHFGMEGQPDQYGPKKMLALVQVLLTAVNAGIYLLMIYAFRIDPKKSAFENKGRMQKMAFAIAVFMMGMQLWIIYRSGNGNPASVNLVFIAVGLLFAVMGNYMYHIRPNYFAGFRVPWTLEHPDNWRKTHQLAGWAWFIGGLVIAICSLLLPLRLSFILMLAVAILMLLIPGIFSYRYYKRHNA